MKSPPAGVFIWKPPQGKKKIPSGMRQPAGKEKAGKEEKNCTFNEKKKDPQRERKKWAPRPPGEKPPRVWGKERGEKKLNNNDFFLPVPKKFRKKKGGFFFG